MERDNSSSSDNVKSPLSDSVAAVIDDPGDDVADSKTDEFGARTSLLGSDEFSPDTEPAKEPPSSKIEQNGGGTSLLTSSDFHASPPAKSRCRRSKTDENGAGTSLLGESKVPPEPAPAMCVTEDWTDFCNLNKLGRQAGVSKEKLAQVVAKELVDNALDTGADCNFGLLEDGGFYVEDDGPGLPEDIPVDELFSVKRARVSSKIRRMPTNRGALGNGARVVTGAAGASGGTLTVNTRGRSRLLVPQRDGTTRVESDDPWDGRGTRIEVRLGPTITRDDPFEWAMTAKALAGGGKEYKGRTSSHWYDSDGWADYLRDSKGQTVRQVVLQLDGCSADASKIAGAFRDRMAESLTFEEAEELLERTRIVGKEVKPRRLGCVGRRPDLGAYASEEGHFPVHPGRGRFSAKLPFVVEVWARVAVESQVTVCVNRTPIVEDVVAFRTVNKSKKACYHLKGANIARYFKVGAKKEFSYLINITTPHLPQVNNGKAPDLLPLWPVIQKALEKASGRAARASRSGTNKKIVKALILSNLKEGIRVASEGGEYTYSQRQLYYAVRALVLKEADVEPTFGWFCQVLTKYEAADNVIPGMYRDVRGMLYHPHAGVEIPLGTLAVERYERPPYTFNIIVYLEKEGLISVLRAAGFPERLDCALMTAKGFASRAARDVIDMIVETNEQILIFCVHDADAAGTMIYQSLQEGTDARPARNCKVINLGLDPQEAIDMGLPIEHFGSAEDSDGKKRKRRAVASYLDFTAVALSDDEWVDTREWLQTNRIELNAMLPAQFIAWLEGKIKAAMKKAGMKVKVVPPEQAMQEHLVTATTKRIRKQEEEKAIAEAKVDEKVEARVKELEPDLRKKKLAPHVRKELDKHPDERWTAPLERKAEKATMQKKADADTKNKATGE